MKRLAFVVMAVLAAASATAQTYPAKPIRIVIPFGAGSGTDAVMRVLVPHLSAAMGQPIVIDPKPGADGAISASEAARSAPDGYTFYIGTGGPLAAVPALRKNPPYDSVKDFTPITDVGRYTVFLFVNAEVPAKSFQDFVTYVRANPGKVAYATGNPSGIVAWAQINSLLGLKMLHVPYKTAPQVMPDLLTNRVQAVIDSPAVALTHVKDGKLRALVTTLSKRSPLLPEVPSIHEVGVPEFTITNWAGLLGPAGLPREVVMRLNAAVVAAVARKELADQLVALGYEMESNTPEQFAAFLRDDSAQWLRLIKMTGASAE